ncbi:MAG: hypothetical protein HY815_19785 [Candidatus Riflebacteria bacterium]|nr:hypothetical protein [Candidatus Riflebacteria bacterium]
MARTGRRIRGEAPLPLVLAGAAALTALLVVMGGMFTRSSRPPPQQQSTDGRYLQTLEGVMDSFGRPGSTPSGSGQTVSQPTSPQLPRSGAPASTGQGLHGRILASLSHPDVLVRKIGHPAGDFVFTKSQGWLRFDLATSTFRSTTWAELPEDLKAHYPKEIFGDRGRGGGSSEVAADSFGASSASGPGGRGGWTGTGSGGEAAGSGGPGGRGGPGGPAGPGAAGAAGHGSSGPPGVGLFH